MTMNIQHIARNIHDQAGDTMIYISPILAPVVSAIAVYAGLVDDFGRIAAMAGAFSIEGLGFAGMRLMFRAKEETDSRMLWGATMIMTVIYLGAVYGIIMTTHIGPQVMAFPLLTVTGAMAYAVNGELDRRKRAPMDDAIAEIDLKAYKTERMAEARAKAKALSGEVSAPVSTRTQNAVATSGGQVSTVATVDDLRVYMADNPTASIRTTAADLGMSKSWVQTWRKRIEQEKS